MGELRVRGVLELLTCAMHKDSPRRQTDIKFHGSQEKQGSREREIWGIYAFIFYLQDDKFWGGS